MQLFDCCHSFLSEDPCGLYDWVGCLQSREYVAGIVANFSHDQGVLQPFVGRHEGRQIYGA